MTHRICLAAAALAAFAGTASAQLVVLSDDFNSYTDGNLVGQGGWTQTGTTATNPLQVAGSPAGYVQFTTTGQDVYKTFSATVPLNPAEYLETEFDINISAAQATGDYFVHLSNPAGTTSNFYQRVFARSSGSGFELGLLDTSGTGSATTWGSTILDFGTSYRVKITWNFVAGGNNDTFALDVNSVNYLNHVWTSALAEPTDLAAANFRQGTGSSAPTVQVDNLTVTSVPGPGSFACLAAGLFLAGRRRR